MFKTMNDAIKNVIDLHIWIEDVFSNPNAQESLKKLLASFDQNFKMITIQGHCISLAEVSSLFRENIGKKSAFKITISNVIPLFEAQNHYWIQYQEHQQTSDHTQLRISTACIRVESGKCYWQYLHETLVQ
ncbi:hypothetical protein PYR74_09675 [Acinetobacter bereziniae]|uniref:hypothetical protein n=1 Tax=Acinetobacter bereziniae TaxID=106648 RepID=UPI001580F8FE|nr:hypothetical protein [Acinetobacter bereziniae]NUF63481.1 hypothetical protein [Acinetobacter bereziniae]NUG07017.1 hypothetical protein [Acinetobacter bereziniae]NUG64635.1 hypothetical protein [Acinetobacter bereziniae]NUG69994.1 hypothetical protein [Acinetobacter bereziniae]WEI24142.1 hypothetical protein PYR74_09675 [Acinetobacter bereziniae]